MQEVFEKIIEKLEELNIEKQSCSKCAYREECDAMQEKNDIADDVCLCTMLMKLKSIEIVKQTAAEYYKEKYFNLDHATLHKCPKCGADAEHRVNRKGLWACGCFDCNLFKAAYDHGKAIQAWEDFCAEYNNGWIPCSEPPKTNDYILLSFSNFSVPIVGRYEENEEGGAYYIGDEDKTCASQDMFVNAWQSLPDSYQSNICTADDCPINDGSDCLASDGCAGYQPKGE